jgi:hypothetical protein
VVASFIGQQRADAPTALRLRRVKVNLAADRVGGIMSQPPRPGLSSQRDVRTGILVGIHRGCGGHAQTDAGAFLRALPEQSTDKAQVLLLHTFQRHQEADQQLMSCSEAGSPSMKKSLDGLPGAGRLLSSARSATPFRCMGIPSSPACADGRPQPNTVKAARIEIVFTVVLPFCYGENTWREFQKRSAIGSNA